MVCYGYRASIGWRVWGSTCGICRTGETPLPHHPEVQGTASYTLHCVCVFSLREALTPSKPASMDDLYSGSTTHFHTNPLSATFSHWHKKDKWRWFPLATLLHRECAYGKQFLKVVYKIIFVPAIQRSVTLHDITYDTIRKKKEKREFVLQWTVHIFRKWLSLAFI